MRLCVVLVHADAGVRRPRAATASPSFRVEIVSVPVPAIASRALTARLSSTCPIWPGSASIGRRSASSVELDADALADQAAQHRLDLADGFVQVEHPRLQHLPAAEREELLRERRRPIAGRADLLGEAPLALVGERRREELGVAVDREEQVVEVVRDAACEPSDRLHLLRLAKLLGGLLERELRRPPCGPVALERLHHTPHQREERTPETDKRPEQQERERHHERPDRAGDGRVALIQLEHRAGLRLAAQRERHVHLERFLILPGAALVRSGT